MGGAWIDIPGPNSTRATAKGGRDGNARSEDGKVDVKLSTPKELGGAGGPGTNPEQLFAAGYSACFIGAMKVATLPRYKSHEELDAMRALKAAFDPKNILNPGKTVPPVLRL